jgi:hypothetical protein
MSWLAGMNRAGQQLGRPELTERGTPVNPNHASRAFARLAASVGLAAHPHLLRHALASAMAANKEPASIIAAPLRHADGGALAQRVYIHQLPQTAPRLAGVIEGVFGPAARDGRAMSAGRRAEGGWRETWPPSDQSSAPMCGGRRRFDPSGRRNTLPTRTHDGVYSMVR